MALIAHWAYHFHFDEIEGKGQFCWNVEHIWVHLRASRWRGRTVDQPMRTVGDVMALGSAMGAPSHLAVLVDMALSAAVVTEHSCSESLSGRVMFLRRSTLP